MALRLDKRNGVSATCLRLLSEKSNLNID